MKTYITRIHFRRYWDEHFIITGVENKEQARDKLIQFMKENHYGDVENDVQNLDDYEEIVGVMSVWES